jgi:lipoprotein NlpD
MKNLLWLGMLKPMDRHLSLLGVLTASLMLTACGSMRSSVVFEPAAGSATPLPYRPPVTASPARTPIPGGNYEVKKGETLYSIAFRNGVDFRDLAQWNAIAAPYTIWPGQRLKLSPARGSGTITHVAAAAPATAATPGTNTPHAPSVSMPSAASTPMFEPITPSSTSTGSASKPIVPSPLLPQAQERQKPSAPVSSATAPTLVPVAGVPPPPTTLPPPAPVSGGSSRAIGGVSWRWPAQGSLLKRFQSGDAIPGIEIGGKGGDPVRAAADGVVVYSGNGLVGYGELVIIKHNDSFLSAYGHNSKRLVKEGQRVTAGQQIAEMGSTGASRDELEFQIRKDGNPVDPLGYLPWR